MSDPVITLIVGMGAFMFGGVLMASAYMRQHVRDREHIAQFRAQTPLAKPKPYRESCKFAKKPDPLIQSGWTPKGLVEK